MAELDIVYERYRIVNSNGRYPRSYGASTLVSLAVRSIDLKWLLASDHSSTVASIGQERCSTLH